MPHTARAQPRAALEFVHRLADAEVALASPAQDWDNIAITRFRLGKIDISLPALGVPVFGINYGPDMHLERTLHGQRIRGSGKAGYLSLLPPDADTRWVFDEPGDVVLVFLNRALFEQAIEELSDREARSVEIVPQFVIRDLVLERIAHQLLREVSEPGPARRLQIDGLAHELATHFLAEHTNLGRQQDERLNIMAPNKLRRAEEYILANLQAELSLRGIANAAGMSLYHFAKAFKHTTGRPPQKYVKEQRLQRARTLLHNPSVPISEVAQAVGLSHSYFTAEFREHMGMTPREFREVLQS
jgi:AraC family transcriptional regulator